MYGNIILDNSISDCGIGFIRSEGIELLNFKSSFCPPNHLHFSLIQVLIVALIGKI